MLSFLFGLKSILRVEVESVDFVRVFLFFKGFEGRFWIFTFFVRFVVIVGSRFV